MSFIESESFTIFLPEILCSTAHFEITLIHSPLNSHSLLFLCCSYTFSTATTPPLLFSWLSEPSSFICSNILRILFPFIEHVDIHFGWWETKTPNWQFAIENLLLKYSALSVGFSNKIFLIDDFVNFESDFLFGLKHFNRTSVWNKDITFSISSFDFDISWCEGTQIGRIGRCL